MKTRRVWIFSLLVWLTQPVNAFAATVLHYTSGPGSWVGGGETVVVSTADGFAFEATRNFYNGVSFWIDDFDTNPLGTRWWSLDFSAPNSVPLSAGTYLGATRYPFQSSQNPGLSFTALGRGTNTLTGQFSVLEAAYALDGSVSSFAADFLQYDDGIASSWVLGSIRYNSSVAVTVVPIPTAFVLLLSGMSFLFLVPFAARRR